MGPLVYASAYSTFYWYYMDYMEKGLTLQVTMTGRR